MRKFYIPLIAAIIAFPGVGKADAFIDKPENFKLVMKNVSHVLLWGMWFDRCVADRDNAEFKENLQRTFKYVMQAADGNVDRGKQVIDAALRDAADYFPSVNCIADKNTVRGLALEAVNYLPVLLNKGR